jgi:type IV pilus assembly protein PilO
VRRPTGALVAAGAAAALLVWYLVWFAPARREQDEVRDQIAAAQAEERELERTRQRLEDVAARAAEHQTELVRLRSLVPDEPDIPTLILAVNHAAHRAGVKWVSVLPAGVAPSATGQLGVVPVSMQVEGSFFQIVSYLRQLETLPRLVVVDAIDVSRSAGGDELSVSMSARVFTGGSGAGAAQAAAAPGDET